MVAMLMVGGVELLRDVSAMRRHRVLAILIGYDDDGPFRLFGNMSWTGLLLLVASATRRVSCLIAICGVGAGRATTQVDMERSESQLTKVRSKCAAFNSIKATVFGPKGTRSKSRRWRKWQSEAAATAMIYCDKRFDSLSKGKVKVIRKSRFLLLCQDQEEKGG